MGSMTKHALSWSWLLKWEKADHASVLFSHDLRVSTCRCVLPEWKHMQRTTPLMIGSIWPMSCHALSGSCVFTALDFLFRAQRLYELRSKIGVSLKSATVLLSSRSKLRTIHGLMSKSNRSEKEAFPKIIQFHECERHDGIVNTFFNYFKTKEHLKTDVRKREFDVS